MESRACQSDKTGRLRSFRGKRGGGGVLRIAAGGVRL